MASACRPGFVYVGLGSYELGSRHRGFAGYGPLNEKLAFRDGGRADGEEDYLTSRRGVFFKARNLYRF